MLVSKPRLRILTSWDVPPKPRRVYVSLALESAALGGCSCELNSHIVLLYSCGRPCMNQLFRGREPMGQSEQCTPSRRCITHGILRSMHRFLPLIFMVSPTQQAGGFGALGQPVEPEGNVHHLSAISRRPCRPAGTVASFHSCLSRGRAAG